MHYVIAETIPDCAITDDKKKEAKKYVQRHMQDMIDFHTARHRHNARVRKRKQRAHERGYTWDAVNECEVRPEEDRKRLGRCPVAFQIMAKKRKSSVTDVDQETAVSDVSTSALDVHHIDKMVFGSETSDSDHEEEEEYVRQLRVEINTRDAHIEELVSREWIVTKT